MTIQSLFALFLISMAPTLAADADKASADQQGKDYVMHLKQKEDSKLILESNEFKECKAQAESITDPEESSKKVRECFATKLDNTGHDEIKKIAKNIDLNSFNVQASKTGESIKNYLKDRLDEALYGDKINDPKQADKIKKYVGQEVYFKLYKAQVGKNIMLETSAYCLENLRGSDKKPIFINLASCDGTGCANKNDGKKLTGAYWLNDAVEVEYKASEDNRKELDDFIKKEMEAGPDYLKQKMGAVCAPSIHLMCARYECANTVSAENTEGVKKCEELYKQHNLTYTPPAPVPDGAKTDIALTEKKSEGRIACALHTRLKEYRKGLVAVEENMQQLRNLSGNSHGFARNAGYEEYTMGKGQGEKDIDTITTVASSEITNNDKIKELKDADKTAKELEGKCSANADSQECKDLVIADQKKLEAVAVEYEASTALEIKRIKGTTDKKELEAYLKNNGLGEYVDKIDTLSEAELTSMIADKYKAKRMAVLNHLRGQLEPAKKTGVPDKDKDKPNPLDISKGTNDIKDADDRLGALIHYNNVVSSFLVVKDEKTKKEIKGVKTKSLEIETKGLEKFKDDNSEEKVEYLTNMGESGGGSDGGNINGELDYKGLIDIFIEGKQQEDKPKAN